MGIRYALKEEPAIKRYNRQIEPYLGYPENLQTARKIIDAFFADYECPSCGSKRLESYGVFVRWRKVHLYKDEEQTLLFGMKQLVTRHFKTVIEILGVFLKPSGFLEPPGNIKCQACGWEVKGEKRTFIRWVSINDIERSARQFLDRS